MRATASGHGQVNQAQTQVIYQYGRGDQGRPAAVVEQVPAHSVAGLAVFVGRDRQVDELLAVLDPAGPGPVAAVVSAVSGLGGVGKTALARRAAGLAVERGWFPGGALLVDLHGYDPDPKDRVTPGQVFAPVLRALGLPADQVPLVVQEQAAVYHRLLAQRADADQPVLLVFDNASTTDQLTSLLPRHQAHRALVTSRHTLNINSTAHPVDLDMLDQPAAVDLLNQTLRQRDPADSRISDQRADAETLVGLCGRLPLALEILAGLLTETPARPLALWVAELSDTTTRLDGLTHADSAVRATFDLSWHHLLQRDPAAARLFRLLPVNPGPDLSVETAAALANEPPHQTVQRLRVLRWAHLVDTDPAGERWRMHDLIRLYATRLLNIHPEERAAAIGQLLRHYCTAAHAAADHLCALPGSPVPDRSIGSEQALSWFDTERLNLTAAVQLAADAGHPKGALVLASSLPAFLQKRRHLADFLTTATIAVHAAARVGDHRGDAAALNNLGLALQQLRRFGEAITAYQQAVDIYRQTGDRHHEGDALNNLGAVLTEARRFDEAITAHQQAADIYRQFGDRHHEGGALNNLGLALRQMRRFGEAITAHQQAVDIYRQTGDRHREGGALNNLGAALRQVGRFGEAITAHQKDLVICREVKDRHGEAGGLNNLGVVLRLAGRSGEAIAAHEQAAGIFQETGDRHGEGTAWNNLGSALGQAGRFEEAVTALGRAIAIYQETHDRHGQGQALNNLGTALRLAGRFDGAITAHDQAVEIFQETGDRHGEGGGWNNLANALIEVGRFDRAITALDQAVAAFTETGATEDADRDRRLIQAIEEASRRPDPKGEPQP